MVKRPKADDARVAEALEGDYGAWDKAIGDGIVKLEDRVRKDKSGLWLHRWTCHIGCCAKPSVESKDPSNDFRSHVLRKHDACVVYKEGEEPINVAEILYPKGVIKFREKQAERRRASQQAKEAKETHAVHEDEPNVPTLESAVDALVAAGFQADGEGLSWLANEVKKRKGEQIEPVRKKPRGLNAELASLGGEAPAEVARGGAARLAGRSSRH